LTKLSSSDNRLIIVPQKGEVGGGHLPRMPHAGSTIGPFFLNRGATAAMELEEGVPETILCNTS